MSDSSLIKRILDWLNHLFGQTPTVSPPEPGPAATGPEPAQPLQPEAITPVSPRVSLIIYNPLLVTQRSRRLTDVLAWNDPDRLVNDFIADLKTTSHGYVNYQVIERMVVDDFPPKEDGFAYTGEEYLQCYRERKGFHAPDGVDYFRMLYDFGLQKKVRDGAIDEVWAIGFPWAGFYESRMAGPGAFWCNAPPLEGTESAGRRYVIMGFNFERGMGEMLESYAHRVESIMEQVYHRMSASDSLNYWKRYIRYDQTHPGQAEMGSVHFAPNSQSDYDWGNPTPVPSRCRNWPNFPDLSGAPAMVSCAEWGGGDIRAHHRWWLAALPHIPGKTGGIRWNWWEYIADVNKVGS